MCDLFVEQTQDWRYVMQDEKIYKTMSSVGVWGLVLGVLSIVIGALTGAALIANSARLLKKKSDIMF